MPVYVYQCGPCTSKYTEDQLKEMSQDEYGAAVLFETFHPMEPMEAELKEAVVCPRCQSGECEKTFDGVNIRGYIRGYGWKDKVGARRDMDVYHLDNQDPYATHRAAGETDHIRTNLKKAGKHDPNTKVFPQHSRKSDDP